jgi:hypothetical protein
MPLFAWAALIFLLLVSVVGAVVTSRRLVVVLRSFRSLQRIVTGALEHVVARTAVTEQRVAAAAATAERLDEAVTRLQRSRSRAAILASAVREIHGSFRRTQALVPRK